MIKNIDFYYFSGTGNTLLAVKKMAEVFEKNGIKISLNNIENTNPQMINKNHTIGLAFPVAGFSTYPFIWDFIKAMPNTEGTKIFMVDTLAGFSGGIVTPLKKVLKKKGYETIGAIEIIMPSNIFYIYPDKINTVIVKNGLKKAEEYAREIISEKSKWKTLFIFSDVFYIFYQQVVRKSWLNKWNQKWFGFKVDKNKCTKCGICARLCPVKNISQPSTIEGFPIFGATCNFCMRCLSLCPHKAIPCNFNFKGKTYIANGINPESLLINNQN